MIQELLRLLAVVRLSRHGGDDDPSTSPERQRATDAALAEGRGEIVGWATDLDVSAISLSPFERPELGVWLNERFNDFDGIVAARLDRVVRSMRDLHSLSAWATKHRKILIFGSGDAGGTPLVLDLRGGPLDPIPHLIVTVLAFAAEMEAKAITERNRETREYLRKAGRWPGGMHPYHLRPVKDGAKGWRLEHNPETLPIMEDIIRRVMAGESRNSIVKDLNRRGVPSPRETRVVASGKVPTAPIDGVVTLLKSAAIIRREPAEGLPSHVRVPRYPAYAEWAVEDGDTVTEGQRLTRPIPWSIRGITSALTSRALIGESEVDGRPVLGPDGMPVKRADPIMSRSEWNRLQEIIQRVTAPLTGVTRTVNASPLLGLLHCSWCGSRMYMRTYKRGGYSARHYGCRSFWGYIKHQSKGEKCQAVSVKAETVERVVERVLLDRIGDLPLMEEVTVAAESHKEELAAATEALADLIERAAGKSDAVKAVYEGSIAALEQRITELSALPETPGGTELRPTGQTLRDAWNTSDRRTLLIRSGVRVEAAKVQGGVSVGLFDRPERDDELISVVFEEGIQVAVFVPRDLAERLRSATPRRVSDPSM